YDCETRKSSFDGASRLQTPCFEWAAIRCALGTRDRLPLCRLILGPGNSGRLRQPRSGDPVALRPSPAGPPSRDPYTPPERPLEVLRRRAHRPLSEGLRLFEEDARGVQPGLGPLLRRPGLR